MSTRLLPNLKQRYLDHNGQPLAGGKVYSYIASTVTPAATYTDQSGSTPNTNPVILDANGEANIWVAAGSFKFVLTDANDVVQWTTDSVTSASATGGSDASAAAASADAASTSAAAAAASAAAAAAVIPSQTGNANKVLRTNGTSTSWALVDLTANVSGVLPIANGGTGQTTQQASMDALAGTQSSGKYLRSDGTHTTLSTIQVSDVPTLNQNTTGTASNVTGTVAIANGGTGQTAKAAAFDALSPNTTLGDTAYHNGTNNVRLAGNTTTTKKYLAQTGNGTVSAAPTWAQPAFSEISGSVASSQMPALTGDVTTSAGATATTIAAGAVDNSKVAAAAGIVDSKLATISTAGKVSNSATTATSANTASAIVARDASGNFTAGTITATLSGNSTNVTGTVAIANGGTGQTTANASLNALLPTQTANAGKVLQTDGSNTSWVAGGSGGAPDVSTATGTLAIAHGGTGQTTAGAAFDALSPNTTLGDVAYRGSSNNVRLAGNTTTTKKFLTQTGDGTNSAAPSWGTLAAGDVPTLNQNTTGSAASLSVTLAIGSGGTGQTTANAALNALLPTQTSANGKVLQSDGTNSSWVTPTSGGSPDMSSAINTLAIANGGTGQTTASAAANALLPTQSGNSGKILQTDGTNVSWAAAGSGTDVSTASGTLAIAHGGTGQTTQTAAFDALAPTTTLGDTLYYDGSDNVRLAGNTTSTKKFLTQTGDGTNSAAPSWGALAAGDVPTLNQNTTGTAANVTGTVAVANGGTGSGTANTGFANLSPMTTKGDIISRSSTVPVRIAVGGDGQVLQGDTGAAGGVSWNSLPSFANLGENLSITASVASSALTVTIVQFGGSSTGSGTTAHARLSMRHATLSNGSQNRFDIQTTVSVTIPSGTTIGTVSGRDEVIYVYAIDSVSGTTAVLGLSLARFDDTVVQSSSAVSGGSSRTTMYSTAAKTSRPIRLLGYLVSNQTTAGTWAAAPTTIATTSSFPYKLPTVQTFTSGSGTYTLPAAPAPAWIRVRMVGGGGGGGGTGTASQAAGGTGGNTTFGSFTAGGGTGGGLGSGAGNGTGGAGGAASGSPTVGLSGADGGGSIVIGASPSGQPAGGSGGNSAFGGGGNSYGSAAGGAGKTNSGGGGSGGGGNSTVYAAGGGGAGAYLETFITNPVATYSYGVGAGGTAGTVGTSGLAGGAGGSGAIIVEEYY